MMHQEGCEVVQVCTEVYPAVQMPSPSGVGPQCRMGSQKAAAENGIESLRQGSLAMAIHMSPVQTIGKLIYVLAQSSDAVPTYA